jgi:hypothetical protein
MKTSIVSLLALLLANFALAQHQPDGAWEFRDNGTIRTLIIEDNYFSMAVYKTDEKKFFDSYGGTMQYGNGKINGKIEFNSSNKEGIGKTYAYPVKIQGNEMLLTRNGTRELWKRLDDGKGQLAGNWRIISREQNGKMNTMDPGPRKTVKILSATRFQWIAINTETGEFFGTGGGKYTLENGKYTEMIEFFSRDSSRVGLSLSFDARVDGREWHHSGKNSRGEPINEIWLR